MKLDIDLPNSMHVVAMGIQPWEFGLGGADIAMLVGLPVSALVYVIACRSLDTDEDRRLARAADIGLDPDEPRSSP